MSIALLHLAGQPYHQAYSVWNSWILWEAPRGVGLVKLFYTPGVFSIDFWMMRGTIARGVTLDAAWPLWFCCELIWWLGVCCWSSTALRSPLLVAASALGSVSVWLSSTFWSWHKSVFLRSWELGTDLPAVNSLLLPCGFFIDPSCWIEFMFWALGPATSLTSSSSDKLAVNIPASS